MREGGERRGKVGSDEGRWGEEREGGEAMCMTTVG